MENQSKAVQKIKVITSETIIEESELALEIENFQKCCEEIVTAEVKLQNIDAEWWLKVGSVDVKTSEFALVFNFSSNPCQSLDLVNCKFSITVVIEDGITSEASVPPKSVPLPVWRDMSELKSATSSSVDLGKFQMKNKDLVLHAVFTVKRFDYSLVRQKFFNSITSNREIVSNMLSDETFADFTFVVKDQDFKVHKNILAAVSPVFKRMFLSNMQEACENLCKVEKIEPETFGSLLKFIYQAKLPDNFKKTAKNIYEAADYYGLEQLKEICEQEVRSQLSADTAVELYEMASMFNLAELKKEAWRIIKRDILKIYFHIKDEPLSPDAIQELIAYKQKDQKYWKTFEEVPEVEKSKEESEEVKKADE